MDMRALGQSGLHVPPLVFGGNVFGWTVDEATSFRLLDGLLDAGFNAVDTADIYSAWAPGHQGGESETVIGRWLAQRGGRDRLVIMTKVGGQMGGGKGLSRDWIVRAVEDSLRRLQTDHIDLYQAHFDDPDTPLNETLGAFADLIGQGKVRAVGASNYSAARLRAALDTGTRLGVPGYTTLQPHYNLIERPVFEEELEAVCLERALGVIPYFSLASGYLTGKYRSEADLGKSQRGDRVKQYLAGRGPRVLATLDEVALRHGATPGQVALAWLMARPAVTAPIASATSMDQLRGLLGAAQIKLGREDMAALDAVSA